MIIQVAPITHRHDLGVFLNWQHLLGGVVEIGTHRGAFAKGFLTQWEGKMYHGIDPWTIPEGYEEQYPSLPDTGDSREHDYEEALKLYTLFPDRVELYRGMSVRMSKGFSDNSLDMVYIDGDHRYSAVMSDLRSWWLKVKPGGYLAGHDYTMPKEPEWQWAPDIQRAVAEFFNGYHVYLIPQDNAPWSYYVRKPSPT